MTKFKELDNGDMFNTKAARFVKTGQGKAICVMSGVLKAGQESEFSPDAEVIVLYSSTRDYLPGQKGF